MARFCIAVHGGAGPRAGDDDEQAAREGCLAAARAGHAILAAGGSALDAVEAAAALLEDDPVFNAGTGSCLNADGEVEMDASLMEGTTLGAGAVAAVRIVRNPIRLARAVLTQTPHVLLCGEGAHRFARSAGFAEIDPATLVTDRQRRKLERARAAREVQSGGTIGAAACDAKGHVAAATSTGGMTGKLPGRVGDTPIPGAGTYADDAGGAASATGHGEMIIRVTLTRFAVDRLRAGATAQQAADEAIASLSRVRGEAGIALVDARGNLAFAFNTARMSRAWVDAGGREGSGFAP